MKRNWFCLLICALSLFKVRFLAAEEAEVVFQQGMEALRAENNVTAVKAFARASELAEAAGNEALATEAGGALFWSRRRLNLQQITVINGDEKVAKKIDAIVNKKVEPSDADKWMGQADKFALAHQDDALRCAIAYYNCGERFSDTAGRSAIKKSLEWMAKIKNEPAKVPKPIVPVKVPVEKGITLDGNSGYVVDSLHDGASVFSNQGGTSWVKPPAELDGKNYTQVPSGKPDGVRIRFDGMQKVFFLVDPSWTPTRNNIAVLKRFGGVQEKGSATGGINKHQLWSFVGKPGQIIEFPVQIIVVSDKINLDKIP